jgi:hypothetical protein
MLCRKRDDLLFSEEKARRTRQDSNPQPTDPKSAALSIELRVHRYDYTIHVTTALSIELHQLA